ncbi:hypothetical protein B0H14DRAFT_2464848, partial [Mycena olivaceomarginata]
MHLPPNSAFPSLHFYLCGRVQTSLGKTQPTGSLTCRSFLGAIPYSVTSKRNAAVDIRSFRHRLVGRCQHLLWYRCGDRHLLGCMEMGTGIEGWTKTQLRHRMGRGSRRGDGTASCLTLQAIRHLLSFKLEIFPCPFGQLRSCNSPAEGEIEKSRNQPDLETRLSAAGPRKDPTNTVLYSYQDKYCRLPIARRGRPFPRRLPYRYSKGFGSLARPFA